MEKVGDASDLTAVRIAEFDYGHFDDFVPSDIEACGLEIDDDPDLAVAAGWRGGGLPRDKTADDPVVAGGF
ncbi:MAG TPA: hypothetical protein VIJ35_05065 [Bradyrhizobium sp.]